MNKELLQNKQPEPIETFFPTKKKTVYKKKGVKGWRGYKNETIKPKIENKQ